MSEEIETIGTSNESLTATFYPPIMVQETVQEKDMIAVNYTTARANLKHYMDLTRDNSEPVTITARGGNCVLLSEDEYNNLMENLYIFTNPAMVDHLRQGIADIEAGNVVVIEDWEKFSKEAEEESLRIEKSRNLGRRKNK